MPRLLLINSFRRRSAVVGLLIDAFYFLLPSYVLCIVFTYVYKI